MTTTSRGTRAVARGLCSTPRITFRSLTTTTSTSTSPSSPLAENAPPITSLPTSGKFTAPITKSQSSPADYIPHSGILLTRPPLLVPPLSPFEKSFFLYQKRLNERLSMPFTRYFYYKDKTPALSQFKEQVQKRNGVIARDIGDYNPWKEGGWNDEILERERGIEEPRWGVERVLGDVRGEEDGVEETGEKGGDGGMGEKVRSRFVEGENKRGSMLKRLDRRLARTLYLVVKGEDGVWRFPSGGLVERENLHQAAERILIQTLGPNMNTWIIGHAPIGHYIHKPLYNPDSSLLKHGAKTFFMKGRIMAGQAKVVKGNLMGVRDFRWLTREEVERTVKWRYWSFVKGMLGER